MLIIFLCSSASLGNLVTKSIQAMDTERGYKGYILPCHQTYAIYNGIQKKISSELLTQNKNYISQHIFCLEFKEFSLLQSKNLTSHSFLGMASSLLKILGIFSAQCLRLRLFLFCPLFKFFNEAYSSFRGFISYGLFENHP